MGKFYFLSELAQEVSQNLHLILSFPFLVFIIYKFSLAFFHNKEQCYTRFTLGKIENLIRIFLKYPLEQKCQLEYDCLAYKSYATLEFDLDML